VAQLIILKWWPQLRLCKASVFMAEILLKLVQTVEMYFPFNHRGQTGVDVMITIFCDFSKISAKKLAFFLNTNVMINFFQNLALFRVKNAIFFSKFFGENI
jgi:hypothetical protein